MLRTRSRRLAMTLGVVLPALALAACGSSGSAEDNAGGGGSSGAESGGAFEITLLTDLSGVGATNAKPGASGVQAAIKKINDDGGVHGKQLALDIIDLQSGPDTALTAAQKAVSENPLAVIMFGTSAEGAKVTPVIEAANVAFLSPALPDGSLYPPKSTDFMPSITAKQAGFAMAEFAKSKAGGSFKDSVIDIAAINSPYIDTVIATLTAQIEAADGKVTRTERYDYGIASFATQAGNIARDEPTIVFMLGAANDSIVVSKALTAAGAKALQIGTGSNAGEPVLQALNNPNYWAPTENVYPSQNPDFLAAAESAGVQDGVLGSTYSNAGWVATYLFAEGLSKCGEDCDSTKLPAAIEQITGYTVPGGVSYGPINLSATNHITASVVRFHSYDPATGKFVDSDPIDLAGA
jgi:branched-chain amino acid transport system substrate-binding protein